MLLLCRPHFRLVEVSSANFESSSTSGTLHIKLPDKSNTRLNSMSEFTSPHHTSPYHPSLHHTSLHLILTSSSPHFTSPHVGSPHPPTPHHTTPHLTTPPLILTSPIYASRVDAANDWRFNTRVRSRSGTTMINPLRCKHIILPSVFTADRTCVGLHCSLHQCILGM